MSDTETSGDSGKKKSNTVLYIALALMTGAAGFFGFRSYQEHEEEIALHARATTDSIRIADLDSKYTETLSSLNSYKGLNVQLDSIIKVREGELSKCRNEFLTLVRKNKISEEEYQKQLADLRNINESFQNQITQLQAENRLLKIARDSLGRLVLVQNDSIALLNDSVASLSQKVLLASLLKPTNIAVTPTRTKKNNKDAGTKKAGKVDQLKICFDIPQNDVARADTQVFQIRIINPAGETLSGSTPKSLTLVSSGESIPYSISSKVQYKNAATHACAYFRANVTYTSGNYSVEIYQKGYLVGTQKFILK
jgi:hypothetical protein